MIPITPDANVVASGLVRAQSPPAELWRLWEAGEIEFVLSEQLLAEIERTVAQPYFQRARTKAALDRDLDLLRQKARIVPLSTPVSGVASHAEDDRIIATAVSGGARFLVTGDHDLLRLGRYQDVTILTVRAFLATLPGLIEEQIQ